MKTRALTLCLTIVSLLAGGVAAQHGHDATASKKKILIIAANPSVSAQTGWPIGCWAAELTHPYWEFIQAGYEVEIASPNGGKLEFDADGFVGKKIQPFWIESEARKMANTNFIVKSAFAAFAVRDGNLITGQQQNSGAEAARLVIEALGR